MPLIAPTGSLSLESSRERPQSLRPEIVNKYPQLDGQAILDERVVEKTFLNNTAMMEDTFQQNKDIIAGLNEGRIVKVTYYSQNAPLADVQSDVVDLTMKTKDDVHISWTEIVNFELRLPSEISFEFQDGENVSNFQGEAITLPGFSPKVGDIFLLMVRNDKIGVFTVSSVARLVLGQETYHRITFTMEDFLSEERRNQLKKQSTTWYFDKTKFLVGNNAYLNTEGYIQQKELRHIRREIIVNFMDRFYDKDFSSIMRPDKVYDPYVVEYWNKKVSISDCRVRPIQLLITIQNYHRTIWSILTMNPIKNLKNVDSRYDITTFVSSFWGVNMSSLLGQKFLQVGEGEPTNFGGSITTNSDGSPVSIGPSMRATFHGTQFDELIKKHAEKAWDISRHAFYGHNYPHQKCAPHQHPADFSAYSHLPPDHPGKPPFPVVTTHELYEIWKKQREVAGPYRPIGPNDLAEFRGYVQWYREQHPGSYSIHELEEIWRRKNHIPPKKEMTAQQKQDFLKDVKSYRRAHFTVLNDREIEYNFRKNRGLPMDATLSGDTLQELDRDIELYRERHGTVPTDEATKLPPKGNPFTQAEIDSLRDPRPTESDGSYPKIPQVFIHHHLAPHHHETPHHHDVCHHQCGEHSCCPTPSITVEDDRDYYVLSKAFYLGSQAMNPFEKILYAIITNQEFKVADVLAAVSAYLDWDDDTAFYWEPLSLYLIDKALHWLRFHS